MKITDPLLRWCRFFVKPVGRLMFKRYRLIYEFNSCNSTAIKVSSYLIDVMYNIWYILFINAIACGTFNWTIQLCESTNLRKYILKIFKSENEYCSLDLSTVVYTTQRLDVYSADSLNTTLRHIGTPLLLTEALLKGKAFQNK